MMVGQTKLTASRAPLGGVLKDTECAKEIGDHLIQAGSGRSQDGRIHFTLALGRFLIESGRDPWD